MFSTDFVTNDQLNLFSEYKGSKTFSSFYVEENVEEMYAVEKEWKEKKKRKRDINAKLHKIDPHLLRSNFRQVLNK